MYIFFTKPTWHTPGRCILNRLNYPEIYQYIRIHKWNDCGVLLLAPRYGICVFALRLFFEGNLSILSNVLACIVVTAWSPKPMRPRCLTWLRDQILVVSYKFIHYIFSYRNPQLGGIFIHNLSCGSDSIKFSNYYKTIMCKSFIHKIMYL